MKDIKESRLYSEELGISLKKNSADELFKWFLAGALFGCRISEKIAANTYKTLEKYKLLSPEMIIDAGWDFLIDPVMREGGYIRYDNQTSTRLIRNSKTLLNEYGGSFKRLHNAAKDERDLEAKLKRFSGVGPVTANIFLRELRPFWPKANPEPLSFVRKRARKTNIDLETFDRKSITFARIEAGLVRSKRKTKAGVDPLSLAP